MPQIPSRVRNTPDWGGTLNARIDLAIIAGLSDDPNYFTDQPNASKPAADSDQEPTVPDQYRPRQNRLRGPICEGRGLGLTSQPHR
jgi:hypothetical protein